MINIPDHQLNLVQVDRMHKPDAYKGTIHIPLKSSAVIFD